MEMYEAEVICDSISSEGHRITTMKVVYPHAVHKDLLRHRAFNRNVESFRARPPEDIIADIRNGKGFKPDTFAQRVKGMSQGSALADFEQTEASQLWDGHVKDAVWRAEEFLKLGAAKQQVNFLLQDLCPVTEIITATDWDNFFALRCELDDNGNPVARPEVFKIANAMREAIATSTPKELRAGHVHLPFLTEEEHAEIDARLDLGCPHGHWSVEGHWIHVSAGRCARISFGDFKWWEEPSEKGIERAARILSKRHMSPFEQQARPFSKERWSVIRSFQAELSYTNVHDLSIHEQHEILRMLEYSGNLHGWIPARKNFDHEWNYALMQKVSDV